MKVSPSDILDAHIVIVGDQEASVRVLEEILTRSGYTSVASTTNPLEVGELHRKNRSDLILFDWQMPHAEELPRAADLKTNDADDLPPVLVVSAQPDYKLRALQSGAKDFISKPYDPIEVQTRIHNLLELGLMHKRLQRYASTLERTVQERTAQLRESEARYRRLTELASDWYWEQDERGAFTRVSGPAREMLGVGADASTGDASVARVTGWNEAEREVLRATIAARQPFLDFVFSRVNVDGSRQRFQVSGEPMFNESCRFIGYRGVGVELAAGK